MSTKILVILIISLTVILGVRFALLPHNTSNYINGQEFSLSTTLTSLPKVSGSFLKLTVYDEFRTPIYVTMPLQTSLEFGDLVKISGILSVKVLHNGETVLSMYFPKIEATKNEQKSLFLKSQIVSKTIRDKTLLVYKKALPSDLASLLSGMVFGYKEEFSNDFKLNLQRSGVMHVVAASGMNVALIGGFVSGLLMRFMRRQLALSITIVVLCLYCALAGFQASIIRATIMGGFMFFAGILGRQYLAVFGLFLAGFGMLFIDPLLLWDVGFQLSFLATLGLMLFSGMFEAIIARVRFIPGFVHADLATTLSAQLVTLPILLGTFGMFSPFSVLVNALVLWTTPILMILGALSSMLGFIAQSLGMVVAYVSLPFLLYFQAIVRFFGPLSVVEFSLSPVSVVGYYMFLISLFLFVKTEHK